MLTAFVGFAICGAILAFVALIGISRAGPEEVVITNAFVAFRRRVDNHASTWIVVAFAHVSVCLMLGQPLKARQLSF